MKVDAKGNLFATGPGGVLVFAPDGTHLGTLATGDGHRQLRLRRRRLDALHHRRHQLTRVKTSTKGQGY